MPPLGDLTLTDSFSRSDNSPLRRKSQSNLGSRLLVALAALTAVAVVGVAAARGAACRALVALGSVEIEPSPAGMSVRLSGNWEFDNLVQVVSALSFNVLLVREDNFVRYRYPDGAFVGSLPGLGTKLDSGIDGDDVLAMEAAGSSEASARFVSVEAQRMKLSSPILAGDGPITVIAYLVIDDDYVSPIISNAISRPFGDPSAPGDDLPPVEDPVESGAAPAGFGNPPL
jgi:hypothetical protein